MPLLIRGLPLMVFVLFLTSVQIRGERLPDNPEAIQIGSTYTGNYEDFHPTQIAVGKNEVLYRQKHIERLKTADPKLYKAYLEAKKPDVVIGPEGKLYVVNGHHLISALANLGEKTIAFNVIANWHDKSEKKFWKRMERKGYVLLQDDKGNELLPKDLPTHFSQLKDDPYRTLAWMTQKGEAWADEGVPFQEFFWAEFYREHIRLSENPTEAEMLQAAKKAVLLSRKKKARDLIGYTRYKKKVCAIILEWIVDLVP